MNRREFMLLAGGALASTARPLHAQQRTTPVIGLMSARSSGESAHLMAAFHKGLQDGGFTEGQNVIVEYRWAEGRYDRLPALATDLVDHGVTVLVAVGGEASVRSAKQAAPATMPLVFAMGTDPVAMGLVKSLNRPGGNATGINVLANQIDSKRFGLLHELVPGAAVIGVLINEKFPSAPRQVRELETAARTLNRALFVAKAGSDAELAAAFDALAERKVGALLVAADPYYDTRRERIVTFATQHGLPAMYQFREYALAGGLMSYGVALGEGYRGVGVYAAKILKGEKPAELPVQLVSKFELVINLKAAKAIGFEFPPTFSARADEVIE